MNKHNVSYKNGWHSAADHVIADLVPTIGLSQTFEMHPHDAINLAAWLIATTYAGGAGRLANELPASFADYLEEETEMPAHLPSSQTADVPIDGKFGIISTPDGPRIGNLTSREMIPADEPLFLLRARDPLAHIAMQHYAEECRQDLAVSEHHAEGTGDNLENFRAFAGEHPDRLKIPGSTAGAPRARWYYFGCDARNDPGHHLRDEQGHILPRPYPVPWEDKELDGGLCPDDPKQVKGRAARHVRAGWTALAYWDRNTDARRNSCSVLMLEGVYTFQLARILAELLAPEILARLEKPLQQSSIKPATAESWRP